MKINFCKDCHVGFDAAEVCHFCPKCVEHYNIQVKITENTPYRFNIKIILDEFSYIEWKGVFIEDIFKDTVIASKKDYFREKVSFFVAKKRDTYMRNA